MPNMRRYCLALVAALVGMLTSLAHAWGPQGHQLVAQLAERQLAPKARQQIDRLLAREPGETLASASTWADEHRDATTAAWHFVNFPGNSCTYDPPRDCPGGNCVVEAVNRQLSVLASAASDEARLLALKYVVHLVADVHQPLHAGRLDDRGGNSYQIQVFGAGSNLHALWDSGLLRNKGGNEALKIRLFGLPVPAAASDLDMSHAAEESCRIVGMPGFYPERKVGQDYPERFSSVLEDRLLTAGARLAGLLNHALR